MNYRSIFSVILGVVCALSLVSCNKSKEYLEQAQEKIKEMKNSMAKEGEGGGESQVKDVVSVDEIEGQDIVKKDRRMVMVEFYSDTCAPCRMIAPMLDRLAEKNADTVRIIKVDVTQNKKWAAKEKVTAIPAFRLYYGGFLVDQFAGAYPEHILQKKIDTYAKMQLDASQQAQQGEVKEGEEGVVKEPAKEPAIRPMPKDWLPAGVTTE